METQKFQRTIQYLTGEYVRMKSKILQWERDNPQADLPAGSQKAIGAAHG
jgi:hypothetical protein